MIELNSTAEARILSNRFGGFCDAVIIDVHLSLPQASAARFGSITLLVQASPKGGSGGEWKNLVLRIDGLDSYRLTEGPGTYLVLSDGLQIHGIDEGRCVLVLSPGEAERAGAGAGWDQYMSGQICSYEVADFIA